MWQGHSHLWRTSGAAALEVPLLIKRSSVVSCPVRQWTSQWCDCWHLCVHPFLQTWHVTSVLLTAFKFIKYFFSFIFRAIIDPIIILLPKVSLFPLCVFLGCFLAILCGFVLAPPSPRRVLATSHSSGHGAHTLVFPSDVLLLQPFISNFTLRLLEGMCSSICYWI